VVLVWWFICVLVIAVIAWEIDEYLLKLLTRKELLHPRDLSSVRSVQYVIVSVPIAISFVVEAKVVFIGAALIYAVSGTTANFMLKRLVADRAQYPVFVRKLQRTLIGFVCTLIIVYMVVHPYSL
jgi:hypothetical protein